MPDFTEPAAPVGWTAPTGVSCALSAVLLESLSAIAAECDLLHQTAQYYSLTKHVSAIEACIADMVEEIAGKRCGHA